MIADILVSVEAIIFRWLYLIYLRLSLISLIVFSNVGSGSNFSDSYMLFILSGSKLSSKDVVILVISNCDGILKGIYLITSVDSDRCGVFELRVTNYSSISFDSCFYCFVTSVNRFSGCSKI